MNLDPLHQRVIDAYHNKSVNNLIIIDSLYESYLAKKREAQSQINNGGRKVLAHISLSESDMSLYELFDDSDIEDDCFNMDDPIEDED